MENKKISLAKKLYIANWKMNMSPQQARAFFLDNIQELAQLRQNADIVLCPSFVSLGMLAHTYAHESPVQWGAQNCSEHESGAFTGEVNALSLQQIGCTYCIVGHSERRRLYGDTNDIVAQKVDLLLAHSIMPIICIGETAQEREQNKTRDVLKAQLAPIEAVCKKKGSLPIVIAYEPMWAIGTGVTPTSQELTGIYTWLIDHVEKHLPNTNVRYLYGGSVSPKNIHIFKKIAFIGGFLIGGASCDFQTFKNIVE